MKSDYIIFMLFGLIFLSGCELRENALVREQTETFTGEIKDKNKDIQMLANKLEVSEEKVRRLELMLSCQEELVKARVDGIYTQDPITIEEGEMNPAKSNKAQKERQNK